MNVVNQFKEIKFKDILLQVKEKKNSATVLCKQEVQ